MRAGTKLDGLGHRMHADARVAPQHRLAVHQQIHAIVGSSEEVDSLRSRQVPEAAPLDAEVSIGQRGIRVDELEAYLGGQLLEQGLACEADVRIEGPDESGRRCQKRVDDDGQPRQRRRRTDIPPDDTPVHVRSHLSTLQRRATVLDLCVGRFQIRVNDALLMLGCWVDRARRRGRYGTGHNIRRRESSRDRA